MTYKKALAVLLMTCATSEATEAKRTNSTAPVAQQPESGGPLSTEQILQRQEELINDYNNQKQEAEAEKKENESNIPTSGTELYARLLAGGADFNTTNQYLNDAYEAVKRGDADSLDQALQKMLSGRNIPSVDKNSTATRNYIASTENFVGEMDKELQEYKQQKIKEKEMDGKLQKSKQQKFKENNQRIKELSKSDPTIKEDFVQKRREELRNGEPLTVAFLENEDIELTIEEYKQQKIKENDQLITELSKSDPTIKEDFVQKRREGLQNGRLNKAAFLQKEHAELKNIAQKQEAEALKKMQAAELFTRVHKQDKEKALKYYGFALNDAEKKGIDIETGLKLMLAHEPLGGAANLDIVKQVQKIINEDQNRINEKRKSQNPDIPHGNNQ